MSTWTSTGAGLVTSGGHYTIRARSEQGIGQSRGIVYLYGRGGDWLQPSPFFSNLHRLLRFAVTRGYQVLSIDCGGPYSWGNDTAIAKIGEAVDALPLRLGARPGKVALVGLSMGNVAAFNYARTQPDRVAAIAGIIPGCDVEYHYTTSLRHEIDAAYGGNWPANGRNCPVHGSHNPIDIAPEVAGKVPWQAWYASDDTSTPPAYTLRLAELMGAQAVDAGAGGHSDTTIGHIDAGSFVAFLDSGNWTQAAAA